MSGVKHRQKGNRAEREIVDLHKGINVHAERYPPVRRQPVPRQRT
jgi:hypothetical protein